MNPAIPPRALTLLVLVAPGFASQTASDFAFQEGDTLHAMAPFAGRGRVLMHSQDTYDPDEGYQDLYGDEQTLSANEGFLWDRDRSDAFPPVALTHTYLLEPGEWVLGYRFEYRSFDGLRDGREDVSSGDVFGTPNVTFAFAPTEMSWQTHTFEGHYGFDEHWTFFASLPFVSKELDVDLNGGGTDSFENSGLGDMRIGVVRDLDLTAGALTLAHLGLGLPTGSYDEDDGGEVLPFVMQNGIGTFALHPGFTYMRQAESWSYGMWGEARIHIAKNGDDYGAGDTFDLSLWAAYPFNRSFSGSLRVASAWWGDYHGESNTIDPDRSPIHEDERQGGARFDVFAGANWDLGGYERLHRLGIEIGFPVDEWLDGPQLSSEFLANVGWQVSF